MKKITLLSMMLVFVAGAFAQGVPQKSNELVKTRLENPVNQKSVKAPVATLTYSSDVMDANIGFGAANDFIILAEFPAATMATYNGNIINKIEIGCAPANLTGDVIVGVWTDTVGNFTSTPAASETVAVADLVEGWNTITLSTPYNVDGSQIWVGYVASSVDYGLYMDDTDFQADGYGDIIYDGTEWGNINEYGVAGLDGNWHIKAIVDDGASFTDVALTAMSVPNSGCEVSATSEVVVTVQNNGSDEITDAFDFMYAINEDYAGETTVAVPVPLAAGASVDVPVTMDLSADGAYLIEAYVAVTGDTDATNDTVANGVINTVPSVVDGVTSYTNTFDTNEELLGLAVVDNNGDDNTWNFYLLETGGTDVAAAYEYSSSAAGDDYLVLNCFDLTAGDYVLNFDYKAQSATYAESVAAYWGTSADVADLTNEIVDIPAITNEDFETSSTTFTIPADGTYYVAFHAYSAADMWVLWVDNVNLTISTDVNDMTASNVAIYPNPANNVVTVENAENAQITIVNMVGQVVASQVANSNRESINISDLSNGTYVIRIENGNEVSTQKLNVIR